MTSTARSGSPGGGRGGARQESCTGTPNPSANLSANLSASLSASLSQTARPALTARQTGAAGAAEGEGEGGSESGRGMGLRRSLFPRRPSRCLMEDNISKSPRDWEDRKEREREGTDRHCKHKEKASYLIEQVFSPHAFPPSVHPHLKGSPLYTDLRLSKLPEGKRPAPPWGLEDLQRSAGDKSTLPALDLQQVKSRLARGGHPHSAKYRPRSP
ncbi:hypothetical protein AAFF_G00067530 [Aldrovandia affinis]|uniref:Major intrinsically disordered Notch2-binding receptor 1-like C-terminal domain-containing protein n=1 Tax=Aldrovandia affinis TaxID=143900 RepID=A0AAD7RZA8_9TELE|nr:hypothetical protein AAFF_G00067530 [Aldrovandia affinis]